FSGSKLQSWRAWFFLSNQSLFYNASIALTITVSAEISLMLPLPIARRTFLTHSAYGLGGLALASLAKLNAAEAKSKGAISPLHHAPKAKRVIHLCMAGGPSQFETLDYKPELKKLHGKEFPESFTKGQQLAQLQNT